MLTRKMLKAMGIEEEKIDQIIEAHTDSTDALKEERDKYKNEVDKLSDEARENAKTLMLVQQELDNLKEANNDDAPYKEKYEAEHSAFEEYKKGVEAEKSKASKVTAYKALLKEAGVSEKRFDSIIRLTSMDEIELDDDGKVKDSDKELENIKSEWSEFIVTTQRQGAGTEHPPIDIHDGGKKMTKEDIDKIQDTSARQKAMLENHELYGI